MLWNEHASILIQGDSDSTEIKSPAVTICPKVSTKHAIAERLGNYIEPMYLPKELLTLRRAFFKCATGLSKEIPSPFTYKQRYNNLCGGSSLSNACKVLVS